MHRHTIKVGPCEPWHLPDLDAATRAFAFLTTACVVPVVWERDGVEFKRWTPPSVTKPDTGG